MIKSIIPLSLIIALRFLGLFIVLPVLSAYALTLNGANEVLVGVVIGGYALTQVLFQIPFGLASDKFGRKSVIAIGLLIFIIGSIIAAISQDIYLLMVGRFLQGAGAIGSVITAMISDMVKEEERGHAMAIMGGSIGISFALAMFLGPLIGGKFGVPSLFWLTASLSFISIIALFIIVPNSPKIIHSYSEDESKMSLVLKDRNLIKMNITNLLQKGMMTLAFMMIPIIMAKAFNIVKTDLMMVYLPAIILGLLAMGPSAMFGEKKGKSKLMLVIGVILFAIAFLIMGFSTTNETIFIVGITIFFIGFNVHEPLLQSLASKYSKIHQKGAALGVFNSFGYIGTFLGGIFGGILLKKYGLEAPEIIAFIILALSIAWIFMILSLDDVAKTKNAYIHLDNINDKSKIELLKENNSIIEWYMNKTENTLVVKYKNEEISEEEIKSILGI